MKPSLLNISKTMAFATAIGAASAAWATQYLGVLPGSTDFENIESWPDSFMTVPADATADIISETPSVATRPANYDYAGSNSVLSVEASADHPVLRAISTNAVDTTSGSVYVDMLVKPSAVFAADAQPPTVGNADKLLVYFKDVETSLGTTNLSLCVYAGGYFNENTQMGSIETNEYVLACNGVNTIVKDNWYRLVIKAKNVNDGFPAFSIWLGGYGDNFLCKDANNNNAFFSLHVTGNGGDNTISSIGFAGNGCVDDFVASTNDPGQPAELPSLPTTTLSWNPNFEHVYYVINGVTNTVDVAAGTTNIECEAGTSITLIGDTGFRTFTTTSAEDTINLQGATTGDLSWYSAGDGTQGNPYQIPSYDALIAMQQAVAADAAFRSAYYVQTADIDFTGKPAFAGIGAYEKVPTSGTPFTGTYNGQGYTISNVTRAGGNTQGIFNQVGVGGVIENLVVSNMVAATGVTGYGFAIVGNAGGGATLRNLTAAGTFASAENPSGHNIAGIVVRVCGGATADVATTIDSCTNNATIYGGYTKMGGICAIVQEQTGFKAGKVVFTNCANNGTLVCKSDGSSAMGGSVTGNAGIIGYTSANNVELADCYSNGNITNNNGANTDKDGALIGWQYSGYTLKDNGGNSAPAGKKMIAHYANVANVTGFQYATVANGIATTVLPPLTVGATYLLEGNVAASETPVATLTAVGDTIAFDAALGYTFAGTVGNSGAAGIPVASTSGTVTTYTAGYFPRTATAGQDGSAAHPFEIADLDDLQALQAAVAADVGRGLSYVQTADIALTNVWEGIGPNAGKDLVNGTNKNIPLYESEAFSGTYDGGNYTISNFQMANGCDYGALFNSVNNATIKNLKISWGASTLTPGSSGDTGATFVGVARGSTLQNLTTLAGTVTTVTAAKDMGGIVGYLMAGSTVDSCTNEINVASSGSSRKCGGIAIITQEGTGTATIRNCKNSGTVTATNKGGLVGYIGVATTIDGCENTAAVQLFHFQSGSVTASGVNKGNATVASNDKSGGVSGLYFATVDGSVATFVADNALALNGEYKVMSAGATATFAFAEAGTIAFDTALFTPTYAITAAQGLDLTDATSGTVKTYTATAVSTIPDWATDVKGDPTAIDQAVSGKFADWADNVAGSDAYRTQDCSAQFLMNVPVAAEVALTIDGIEVTSEGTRVIIGATKTISGTTTPITLGTTDAGVDTPAINGILNVVVADSISGLSSTTAKKAIPAANLVFVNGKAEVLIPATDGKFVKASVDYSTPAYEITEVTE